ncbi:hypothetical protein RF11_06580 [Thelohanellus kitauei]|uniref:Uncharacterized protein n=1 Tax=Thelohanellus kitauei TaxID=669202 RepID=A0A0C2NL96_THEKT|nr:hypothetical protein RF11_06580 [Thelohanellus kitauei]
MYKNGLWIIFNYSFVMSLLSAVVCIGFILKTQIKRGYSIEFKRDDEQKYPIGVGKARYQEWSRADDRDTLALHSIARKCRRHKYLLDSRVTRASSGVDEGGDFRIFEVEGPGNKFYYPVYYTKPKGKSIYRPDRLARVLESKPFENEY